MNPIKHAFPSGLLTIIVMISLIMSVPARSAVTGSDLAPEFTHSSSAAWLNSPPLTLAQLRGKVVLIEFWTFDCINCRRTLPWVKSMHQRYASDGLVISTDYARAKSHVAVLSQL